MAPSSEPAHPLATLREQITTLEAAITLALADPRKKPVHQLRTATRRIEAQLELLQHLGEMPAEPKPVHKAAKALQRIRRAAGAVRDLDVHRDLLKDFAHRDSDPDSGSAEHEPDRARTIKRDALSLRKTLKAQRSREARALVRMLREHMRTLAPALESMLETLAPAHDITLSAARLQEATRDWYAGQFASRPGPERSTKELHATRKSAKLARYLAESAPGAAGLAAEFESLQQAGGVWHDLLTLADTAEAELGRGSPLSAVLRRDTRSALVTYRNHLRASRKSSASSALRRSPPAKSRTAKAPSGSKHRAAAAKR